MFTLEFGVLNDAGIGDFSLWIRDAEWRLETKDEWLGSGDDSEELVKFLRAIVGNVVVDAQVKGHGDLTLAFENDVTLHAFVVRHSDTTSDAWILYGRGTALFVTSDPPYFGTEPSSLQLGPDIPFIRNVESVFGKEASNQLVKPNLHDLILPEAKK